MKYLITLLISMSIFGQALNKLENSYISKAEKLKAARDKIVDEADAKYKADSHRLAEAYIKSLKKVQIAIVKTGDLEGALKVKAKIQEIEKALASNVMVLPKATKQPSTVVTKPNGVHHDLLGVWQTTNTKGTKYIYTFYKNGTSFHENNSNKNTITGKWEAQGNDIHIVFSNNHSFKLKRSENIYVGPHYKFKKEVVDPFIGKWKTTKISNGNIVTIKKTSTGYTLNNSISGSLWTTASIIINGKLVLSWASFQTLVIESNKQGITYTQYRQKFNGKYPTGKIGKWNKLQMTRITIDPIIGKWRWHDNKKIIEVLKGGSVISNGQLRPTKLKNISINKYLYIDETWILSEDGKTLTIITKANRKYTCTRIKQ